MKVPDLREAVSSRNLRPVAQALPLAVVIFIPGFFTQWFKSDIHAFNFALYWVETLIVLGLGAIVAAFLYLVAFDGNGGRSMGTASILVLVSFTWPAWTLVGDLMRQFADISVVADLSTVLFVASTVWLVARLADEAGFTIVATLIAAGILVALVLSLSPRFSNDSAHTELAAVASGHSDVVILVLDGYARQDILEDDFGSVGPSLVSGLRDRGFAVRDDAVTNYSKTYASISSMMAMDYTFREGERTELSLENMRGLLSGGSPLVHAFQDAGFIVTMFESAWWGSRCGPQIDVCHRTGLIRRSVWSLGQSSPLASIQRLLSPHPFVVVGLQHIRELGLFLDADSSYPRLVFVHVTVPHPPLQLESSCDLVVAGDRVGLAHVPPSADIQDVEIGRERYVSQVQCINREVLAAVDRLVAHSGDLAMLIVSDHGTESRAQYASSPGEWSNVALIERMAILSAVRLPSDCVTQGPARTTVNTIREFVNCTAGTTLAALPERSYAVPLENDLTAPIVDVTDRLFSIDEETSR